MKTLALLVGVLLTVCSIALLLEQRQLNAQLQTVAAQLSKLDQKHDQQTAVLYRGLGTLVPVKMPDDFDARFKAVEAQVATPNEWPTSQKQIAKLLSDVERLVGELPPWAEDAYLGRLNLVRWVVEALSELAKPLPTSSDDLADRAEALNSLKSAAPRRAQQELLDKLREQSEHFRTLVVQARRKEAIQEAEQILDSGKGDAMDAWARLGEFTEGGDNGGQVQDLRTKLRAKAFGDAAKSLAEALNRQVDSLKTLPSQLRQIGLQKAYDAAISQQLASAIEGLPQSRELEACSKNCEEQIRELARGDAEKQMARMREYQRWALMQIRRFEKQYDGLVAQAKTQASIVGQNWTDPEYKRLRNAMCDYLLPIGTGLLEPPVAERFNQAFSKGWKRLDGREDQTLVAEQAAIVKKVTPADMKAD